MRFLRRHHKTTSLLLLGLFLASVGQLKDKVEVDVIRFICKSNLDKIPGEVFESVWKHTRLKYPGDLLP